MNEFANTIRQLERIRASIDRALSALRSGQSADGQQSTTAQHPRKRRKHRMSAEGRRRIAEAARRRWAAIRKAAGTGSAAAAKPRKRRLSPEARQKMAEAAKRRWAAKRAQKTA